MGPMPSSPAIGSDGTIYIGSNDDNLYAVNPDGTEKWRYVVPGRRPVRASPAIASDGTIYVTTKAYWDDGKKPALCLAFDLYNVKLVDYYKSKQKNLCKMAAVIAKRKIEAISVDMKKTFSAESAEKWLKEKN